MAKFVVFEKVSEAIFAQTDKPNLSGGAVTGINLGSGVIAGFAAAIVSQPADTMLSKINKTKGEPGEGTTSRLIKIAKELGLKGSYAGIGARLFMVGTLVCLVASLWRVGSMGGAASFWAPIDVASTLNGIESWEFLASFIRSAPEIPMTVLGLSACFQVWSARNFTLLSSFTASSLFNEYHTNYYADCWSIRNLR